jgi:outer membrane receptor protein involved in Fe transport
MTNSYLSVAPFVYVRYKLNAQMDVITQLKYSLEPPQVTCHIPAVIMQDYRNLCLAVPTTEYCHNSSAALSLRYRNPIRSLFFNIVGKYDWNNNPLINDQRFLSDYILNTFAVNSNVTRRFNVNGNISKGLMSGKIHISLDAGYAEGKSFAMRDGQKISYRQSAIALQPGLKGYFTKWFSTDYKIGYTTNKLRIKNGDASNYQTLKQSLSIALVPLKGWQFSFGGEHYLTRFSSSRSSNLILADASATWEPTKSLEFSLKATNILNKKEYQYASYGLLSETNYMYRIRGRNIMLSMLVRI